MEILIKASQLILSLSILVVLHELGHFIPAKLFKTRVEKFYLFFDPWFSLFKFKRGETEYGIGWLPLGGYVKIAGMIDESMDKEQMKLPPQEWEFRSKPAWQRLIIMLGGVTVNALLGIFIYICILWYYGEEFLPTENVKYGVVCDSAALKIGLRHGDKIVSIDNTKVENFSAITAEIIINEATSIQVLRESKPLNIPIPEGFADEIINARKAGIISARQPFEIADFVGSNSIAEKAGFLKNDKIIGINDSSTIYFDAFRTRIQQFKNKSIKVNILRNGEAMSIAVTVPGDAMLGIAAKSIDEFLTFSKKEYSFIEAIPAGTNKAFNAFSDYLKQLKLIPKHVDSLGGFITIGSAFSPQWDWYRFWNFTAFLSIILAIMNLLPIPALDGGHVMFLFYEIIVGKKPGDKFMERAQTVGMVMLLGLMVLANANDIIRLFK